GGKLSPPYIRIRATALHPRRLRRGAHRLQRVDEAGAVVAFGPRAARAEVFGRAHQDAAHVVGGEPRVALDQQGDGAADLGGGDRGSGGELITRVGRGHEHVDAGRGDRDVFAPVGAGEQRVGRVGRGDGDDRRVGGGIKRWRVRPGVAGGRDQHDAL